jgi:hypothetical protein
VLHHRRSAPQRRARFGYRGVLDQRWPRQAGSHINTHTSGNLYGSGGYGTHLGPLVRTPTTNDRALAVTRKRDWTKIGVPAWLDVYRALGVEEVRLWCDGTIRMYRLSGEDYTDLTHSLPFPDLDVGLLARLADNEDQTQALLKFSDSLRRRCAWNELRGPGTQCVISENCVLCPQISHNLFLTNQTQCCVSRFPITRDNIPELCL